MAKPSFVPGQRWVSNTESELGLGLVVETGNRRIEISFPAAGERRTYAENNAPLSRVHYEVGQQISDADDESMTIRVVEESNHCLIYLGVDAKGDEKVIPEIELNSFVHFSKPQDRLFAGQIDKNKAFKLRCETLQHIRQQQQSPVRGLLGPRVQLLPHQLYIASEAARRHAPRVLLADEVGLGKTIEAGLIMHQQLLSGRARRVLIVVPDSLVHQWLVEMLRRFNTFFSIFDEERCLALDESEGEQENPFESTQLVLCSQSLFSDHGKRLRQAVEARWDLLIVDEAHHLQWSEQQASPAYQAVEALAATAEGLLLLTATPEQLGIESHFSRLGLLDPDRYYDLEKFQQEEALYQPVNALVERLLAEDISSSADLQSALLQELQEYLGERACQEFQRAIDAGELDAGVQRAIGQLLDRHGTGRVLFRNTRSSVSGFPERLLHPYPLAMPDSYRQHLGEATSEQLLAPELLLGENWLASDPRVEWLEGWLLSHREEKLLLICARARTALELEEYLRLRCGIASAVFHEGLSLINRDRAAAYFADDEDGAQLLICSEIGSEGRNFQFAHYLVLFDLPLNPDLLEQRIGRLDRIGQRYTVELHVPYFQHSPQQVLLDWYHQGINAFEKTCPAGNSLYQEFAEQLQQCLRQCDDQDGLAGLIAATVERSEQTLQELQRGRDRLLELNSCNNERAEQIIDTMLEAERRQELSNYMEQVFDQFGVDQDHHSAVSVVLRPGDHMHGHSFPGLPEDGLTATYQREMALSREDIHYLTWEHPMVTGAMDMVLNGEFGNTAFCTLKLAPLKPGTILLEAIFTVHCPAPASLQLHRYLPLSTVRIVVDSSANDLSKILTAEHLDKLGQKVPCRSAQDLIAHARPQITAMIGQAEQLAGQQQQGLIDTAREAMQQQLGGELERLSALAALNPNIRREEIDYQAGEINSLGEYLQSAQLKLDAIRVALVTD